LKNSLKASDASTIFSLLWAATGVNFTNYKQTTSSGEFCGGWSVQSWNRGGYVQHLQNNPKEVTALYQDLLINVNSFFETLKRLTL
jgi:two-component system CheB/CheR fusion protein